MSPGTSGYRVACGSLLGRPILLEPANPVRDMLALNASAPYVHGVTAGVLVFACVLRARSPTASDQDPPCGIPPHGPAYQAQKNGRRYKPATIDSQTHCAVSSLTERDAF